MSSDQSVPGSKQQELLDEGLREVTLDVDYAADPLWARGSKTIVGNLDLDQFELEESLAREIRAWVHEWETESASWSSAKTERAASWKARGRTLANEVQSELQGHITVYYRYDRRPERPVWEQK